MIRRTILSLALAFAETSAFAQSVPERPAPPTIPQWYYDFDFNTPPAVPTAFADRRTNCGPDGFPWSPPLTLGGNASAGCTEGIAIGNDSISNGFGASAFGVRSNATGLYATAIGNQAAAHGYGNFAAGHAARAFNGNYNTSTGIVSFAAGGDANSAYGNNAHAVGQLNTSIGAGSFSYGRQGTAVGAGAGVQADFGTATGTGSLVSAVGGTANGVRAWAGGVAAVASGASAIATGQASVATGNASLATGNQAAAVGASARALAANCVALGSQSVCDEAATVSVGNDNAQRRIVNVADGVEATDAVNVRQAQAWDEGIYNRSVQYTDLRFTVLNDRIDDLDNRLDKVGAMSAAQASLAASSIAASGGKGSIGVALGGYGSETAIAAGYSKAFRSSKGRPIGVTAQASHASGETAWGVAVSFGLR